MSLVSLNINGKGLSTFINLKFDNMNSIGDQQEHDSRQTKYKRVNQFQMNRNQLRAKDRTTTQSRGDHKFDSIPETNNN